MTEWVDYTCIFKKKLITISSTDLNIGATFAIFSLRAVMSLIIQTEVRILKLKKNQPIWPPGGHFESDIAENQ